MSGKSSTVKKRVSSGPKKGHNEGEEARKLVFWPEWTEAELNSEKWDTSGKGKDKNKGAGTGTLYEDPDQPQLPSCLASSLDIWKRPAQYFHDKEGQSEMNLVPVIVSQDKTDYIDLISCNEHLFTSKLMCKIVAELQLLWKVKKKFHMSHFSEQHDPSVAVDCWHPWTHIHPWPKGHSTPMYNPQGKYCIKMHWMGKWRKITIDDQLPLDADGRILLPMSSHDGELWPALLTKALLKIINLEGVNLNADQYDSNAIQALTGWFGEKINISGKDSWSVLQPFLKKWEREAKPNENMSPRDNSIANDNQVDGDGSTVSDSIIIAMYNPPQLNEEGLFVSLSDHAHPIIMSKWRDEPLELPPLEPPLPSLEAPYYLGLSNRKPRPGYPPPPPPKTDHRSFEVYSPLYIDDTKQPITAPQPISKSNMSMETTVTASNSSNSTTNQSTSNTNASASNNDCSQSTDMWIDLDEFEATFRPDKFQTSLYYDNMPSASSTPAPAGGVKKGVSTQHVQPASAKATGNILVVDHGEDDPVIVFVNYSSISSWYDSNRLVGLEPVPTLGIRFSDNKEDESCKGEESNDEIIETHSQPAEDTPMSLIPGSLTIQEYTWQHYDGTISNRQKFGDKGLVRLTTAGTKTISLTFPKGRCVLRLEMNAPLGYHVAVYSPVPITMGKEDEVWEVLKKPSAYFLSYGERVLNILMDSGSISELTDRYSLQDIIEKEITRTDCKALRVSILRVLHVIGSEVGLSTTQMYAWKNKTIRLMEEIAKPLPPDDEGDSISSINMIAMREVPLILDGREVKSQDQDRSESSGRKSTQLRKQKALDGTNEFAAAAANQSSVTERSQGATKDNDDDDEDDDSESLAIMAESKELLEEHKKDIGVAIFQCLHAAKPDIICDEFPYGTNEHNRVFHNTYHGTIPAIDPKGWTLLFRDMFTVPCVQTIALKLFSACVSCVVKVIDNDTGEVIGTDTMPILIEPNNGGYTLLGEVWSFNEAIEAKDSWTLSILSSSPHLPLLQLPPSNNKETSSLLTTNFHCFETKKYYLPNRDYEMLRYSVTVNDDCHITIQLSTSKQDACFKLEVLDSKEVVFELEGCGHSVLPSLFLTPIKEESSETEEPRIKPRRYVILATTIYNSWAYDDSAWPYVSMIRNMQKEAAQSNKPSSGKKPKSKTGGSKTPKPSSNSGGNPIDTLDTSKPHWILRVVTDAKDSQIVKVEEDKSREEELKLMQQTWERDQPGRANKAQKLRQKFLDSHGLNKEELPIDEEKSVGVSDTGTTSMGSGTNLIPNFGPVPLRPFNHNQYFVPNTRSSTDGDGVVIMNGDIESMRESAKLDKVKEYREWRKDVNLRRELEAKQRDENKQKQMELAEEWQLKLDEVRNKLNEPREAIREKNLLKLQSKQTPTEDVNAARPGSKGKDAKGKTAKGKKK